MSILEQALLLSPAERLKIAQELLKSLEDELVEIPQHIINRAMQSATEMKKGKIKGLSLDEFNQAVNERIRGKD